MAMRFIDSICYLFRKCWSVSLNPIPLFLSLGNGHAARRRRRIYCRSGAHTALDQQAGSDQTCAPDALPTVNKNIRSRRQVMRDMVEHIRELRF
jgi:hypothetical protein